MKEQYAQQNNHSGFTLLIAILVIGIVLAIGLSILNITLKEYILSGIARESAIALNAADAGMECALYWDRSSNGDKFDVGAPALSITCMGKTIAVGGGASGTAQTLNETSAVGITWGAPAVCAMVSVTKYDARTAEVPIPDDIEPCRRGYICTRVISLGYNKACSQLNDLRTVERGLRAR